MKILTYCSNPKGNKGMALSHVGFANDNELLLICKPLLLARAQLHVLFSCCIFGR